MSVVPRQEIGTVVASIPGVPGYTVLDEEVPCPELDDPSSQLGAGIECTPMGKLCATAVGIIDVREGAPLEVSPLPCEKRVVLVAADD